MTTSSYIRGLLLGVVVVLWACCWYGLVTVWIAR